MRKLPLLAELGYLLGLLGLIRLKTLFLVVRRAIGRQRSQEEEGFPPLGTIEQQRLERMQKFIQAEQAPGVLTREGMEMMKQYMRGYPTWDMADGSSFQFRTPGYYHDLTRQPYWGELTSETECSPPLFSLWSESDPDIWKLHNGIHGRMMGRALWWEAVEEEPDWDSGAQRILPQNSQVQREATTIVNELWYP